MAASEQMYDDESLEMLEDIKVAELISAMLEYSKQLENQVVMLRTAVNNLTPSTARKPYEDLNSDVFQAFDHYPAYQKYRPYIEILMKPV